MLEIIQWILKVVCVKEKLISNIDRVYTTSMGYDRIKRNLNIESDPVNYCIDKIKDNNSIVYKKGKNYYIEIDNIVITINSSSYTIITGHRIN